MSAAVEVQAVVQLQQVGWKPIPVSAKDKTSVATFQVTYCLLAAKLKYLEAQRSQN